MSLLQFAARSLFASWFIADGIDTLRNTDDRASEAEAATNKVVPLVQRVVPAAYSSSVPEQSKTWVRLSGVCKVLGGVMFSTGIGRRLGAGLLLPAAVLDAMIAAPDKDASKEERSAARRKMLQSLALVGGAIIGVKDLQGKPSLSWRADQARAAASKAMNETAPKAIKSQTKRAKAKARKQAKKAKKAAKKLA